MKLKYTLAILLSSSLFFYQCGSNGGGEGTENATEGTEQATEGENQTAANETENPLSKNGITLTLSEENAEFPDAMIEMNMPQENDRLQAGPVEFVYNVKNYQLGNQTSDAANKMCANSAKGQHIHLILNNQPYSAHYESQFNKDMEPGHYVSLAFLSRSYHMSIKQPDAYVITQFMVGDGEPIEADLTAPHMFYSRPKGEYVGDDTKKVMLDFYLVNTELSADGNKVRATINGTEFVLDKWAPYFIEGLPMGDNTIKLELIDGEGNPIEGPFNTVERTVKLSDLN